MMVMTPLDTYGQGWTQLVYNLTAEQAAHLGYDTDVVMVIRVTGNMDADPQVWTFNWRIFT